MGSVKVGHFRIWDGREYLSVANIGDQVAWRAFEFWIWSPQRTWWVDCQYKLQCPGVRTAVFYEVPRSLCSHCRKWKAVSCGHGLACFKWSLFAVKMCASELLMLQPYFKTVPTFATVFVMCVTSNSHFSSSSSFCPLLTNVSATLVMIMLFFHSVYCNELTLTEKLSIVFWRSLFSCLSFHFPARVCWLSVVIFVLDSDRIQLSNQ